VRAERQRVAELVLVAITVHCPLAELQRVAVLALTVAALRQPVVFRQRSTVRCPLAVPAALRRVVEVALTVAALQQRVARLHQVENPAPVGRNRIQGAR
jgi:hypothetical protein